MLLHCIPWFPWASYFFPAPFLASFLSFLILTQKIAKFILYLGKNCLEVFMALLYIILLIPGKVVLI
jgi:hypothetical protein